MRTKSSTPSTRCTTTRTAQSAPGAPSPSLLPAIAHLPYAPTSIDNYTPSNRPFSKSPIYPMSTSMSTRRTPMKKIATKKAAPKKKPIKARLADMAADDARGYVTVTADAAAVERMSKIALAYKNAFRDAHHAYACVNAGSCDCDAACINIESEWSTFKV